MIYNIYAPILNNTQGAFDVKTSEYEIHYTLPSNVSTADIKHVQIKVTQQINNKSIVKTNKYSDSIIYKPFVVNTNEDNVYYTIKITNEDIEPWVSGTLYKIQMRFGGEEIKYGTTGSQFAAWKAECVKKGSFSEWSNVMLIKAITPPTAKLVLNDIFNLLPTDLPGMPKIKLANSFPNFQVQLSLNQEMNNVENLATSQFILYRKKEDEEYSIFEQSPIIEEVLDNNMVEYTFSQQLIRDYKQDSGNRSFYDYKIIYKGTTVNGFQIQTEQEFQMLSLSNKIFISIDATPNKEIGAIDLVISLPKPRALNCILLRASEKTNYSQWEKIKYFDFNTEVKYKNFEFTDWLIESGVKYKYRCYGLFQGQYIESIAGYSNPRFFNTVNKIFSNNVLSPEEKDSFKQFFINPSDDVDNYGDLDFNQEEDLQTFYNALTINNNQNEPVYVDFDYNYLYCDGVQLPLKFNNKMSSFKHTVLATKTDTIGSQYPTIVRNGYVNYAEFPITGLISIAADEQETFFDWNNGYYFNNQLIIPADKVNKIDDVRTQTSAPPNTTVPTLLHNLTDDNIFIERKFREVVEQFLNNGKPKLFKSATEGNFIVSLINISLTPNQQLGRMISEFTSTAYEIAKCDLENCIKHKIHSIGESDMSVWEEDDKWTVGQWHGDPNGVKELSVEGVDSEDIVNFLSSQRGINLYDEIRKQVNTFLDDPTVDYTFQSIERIWIDNFPILTEEDVEVQKRKRDWALYPYNDGWSKMTLKDYVGYAKKAKEYETIYNNQNIGVNEILDLNGGTNAWKHYVKLNKKYEIPYLFNQTSGSQLFASHPLVLNYIAKMSKMNLMDYSVQFGGYEIPVLGQLSGIFTTKDSQVLYNINPYYADISSNSLVPNRMMEDTGATQLPNFYNTMDIITLIKKDIKKYIKTIYQNGRMSLSTSNPYRPKEGEVDSFLVDMNEEKLSSDSFEFYIDNQKYNFDYNVKLMNWIEIEAQPGTKLIINGKAVYIGLTGLYRLNNINENTTITFSSADNKQVEAIINYCFTTEQTIGVGG